jgi:hypothetical protein
MTHFEPLDPKEHQRGNAGYDVPDRCRNCGQPFTDHTNGICPKADDEDYATGYRHGSDSEMPDTRGVSNREAYFEGYSAGSQDRDERLVRGEPHIVIPEWMTPKQVEAINVLYKRSPDGSRNRHEFFTRVQESGIGSDRYAGINWCGMFVGIEPDGYTHT